MFIDEVEIFVQSGRGGDGSMHFRREKYVNRGGPDGGDGGRGGDVILEVKPGLNTLNPFRFKSQYTAQDGLQGRKQKQTGRSAAPEIIYVPPGTLVYDLSDGGLLGDLVEDGQQLLVCKGGRGGRGNVHFKSSRNQAPRTAEKGAPGEERNLRLELKLIADVGLVGVPNAGKSSFLAAVTNARPKVANYPFTTLEPNLGVSELDMDHSLVLADIPGLIEGAHQGVGLGDSFLRHIQRTRVIIHVLDGLAEDPLLDFSQINSELALFDETLSEKPQIVVFNKTDLPEVQERWPEIKQQLHEHGVEEPYAISALTHQELKPVLWKALELLKTAPLPKAAEEIPVYRPEEDPREFKIVKENEGWRVISPAIERAAEMTFWEFEGSVRRFQRLIEHLGVEAALRKAGVEEGDTVYIGDFDLDWQD